MEKRTNFLPVTTEPDLQKINSAEVDNELIVIPDECGDTLWDAVLQQEANACRIKNISRNAASLLNKVMTVQVSDITKAKQTIN